MTDRDPGADRLTALLHDSVADVEPQPALHDIQARTKVTPMTKRPWILAALGAVAATAATVAAVAVVADDDPEATSGPAASDSAEPTPSEGVSTPTEEPSPWEEPSSAPTASGSSAVLPVYYVGDTPAGPRLFREFHDLEEEDAAGPAGRVRVALAEAVSGDPLDPDYRSDWPTGTAVSGVSIDGTDPGDLVWVDLTSGGEWLEARPAGLSRAAADVAVQQLVHTVQAVLESGQPVAFRVDGQPAGNVLGVSTSEPVTTADPMAVQAPVWVTSHQDGDTVDGTFTVEGRGAFFEANVSWQLLQGSDVVKEGFGTAAECCTLSPYSFEVTAPPGDYLLRVYDADVSGGEGGGGEAEDTKRLTVTP